MNDKNSQSIDSIRNRVRLVFKKTGLSQRKFAQSLGISAGLASELLNGGKTLQKYHLKVIAYAHNANEDWLLTGQGNMLRGRSDSPNGPPLAPGIERHLEWLTAQIDRLQRELGIFRSRKEGQTPIAWNKALEIVLEGLPEDKRESGRHAILLLADKEVEQVIEASDEVG